MFLELLRRVHSSWKVFSSSRGYSTLELVYKDTQGVSNIIYLPRLDVDLDDTHSVVCVLNSPQRPSQRISTSTIPTQRNESTMVR